MLGVLGPLRYLVAQLMRALRRWLLLDMLGPQLWQPWSWSISCMFVLSRYALLLVLCLLDTLCQVFASGAFCRCCTARHPTAAPCALCACLAFQDLMLSATCLFGWRQPPCLSRCADTTQEQAAKKFCKGSITEEDGVAACACQ